jgi:hypothetical protein
VSDFKSIRGATEISDLSMNDAAVWSHQHRMYVIGSNSINFPWFIPKDFPKDALGRKDRDVFVKFIDDVNPRLKYTLC